MITEANAGHLANDSAFGLGLGHPDLTNPVVNLVLGGTSERPEQARKIPQTSETHTKSEKDLTSVPSHICDLTTTRMPFEGVHH
jgi:hypothetical protein